MDAKIGAPNDILCNFKLSREAPSRLECKIMILDSREIQYIGGINDWIRNVRLIWEILKPTLRAEDWETKYIAHTVRYIAKSPFSFHQSSSPASNPTKFQRQPTTNGAFISSTFHHIYEKYCMYNTPSIDGISLYILLLYIIAYKGKMKSRMKAPSPFYIVDIHDIYKRYIYMNTENQLNLCIFLHW